MIMSENISIHEMIGLKIEIVKSTNNQIIGITGKIIDETKSMFTIDTKKGLKQIPKTQNTWKFILENNESLLTGNLLEKRSFDRLGAKL